jgi:thioredoxin-related protein
MRSLLSAIAVALGVVLALLGAGHAALDLAPAPTRKVEVLVFEHADCIYCRVFRRDVLPRYREMIKADAAPMRFVDIQKSDASGLGLNSRIDTVPTTVVMRDGREVDRIVGYWGPANFLKLLAHILARLE